MTSFTDTANRLWQLTVDIPTSSRVKAQTGFDLLGVLQDQTTGLTALVADMDRLVNILWSMVTPQAEKISLTRDAFRASFNGDTIDEGRAALVEAIILFSPKKKQAMLREMVKKANEVESLAMSRAEKAIAEMNPSDLLDKISNGAATSKPESSGLIQTPPDSPSAG